MSAPLTPDPILLPTPEASADFARALEPHLGPGDVILLSGPVGAGKSHLCRALIDARLSRLGRREDIPSPTFTLVQSYDGGNAEIWHADLYRLTHPDELDELGLRDACETGICLIEWPDRMGEDLPPGALHLDLSPQPDPEARLLHAKGPDRWAAPVRAAAEAARRAGARAAFRARAGWGAASADWLAGDASTRRYQRLTGAAETAILMDAPPADCGSQTSFIQMGAWLRAQGYSAPALIAADEAQGFLLLEDLGDVMLADHLAEAPSGEPAAYRALTDFLADLHRKAPPAGLEALTSTRMGEMVGLAAEYYAPMARGLPPDPQPGDLSAALSEAVRAAHARLCGDDMVTCLRDFHAENIVPLPDRNGFARLGLLDFQDAVLAHPAYDLASALQDARRDVPAAIEVAECAHYAAQTGTDPAQFAAAYALIGAQRNLRILGIFARLGRLRARPHYIALIPRVWGYVQRNLRHPELADLARVVADGLPEPTPEALQRMIDQCPNPMP